MKPTDDERPDGRPVPTLDDVARRAGVSKSTASRALSRPDLVAPATIARVHDAAVGLGFEPSRVARALAHGRTGLIALVVPTLENTFFTPIINGAQARAAEAGSQLTVAVHEPDDHPALARLARQVDGFLLTAPRGDDDSVRAVARLAPTVLIDREVEGITSVSADVARAFGEVVGHLAGARHRRIAYLGGPHGSWQSLRRSEAVHRAALGRAELSMLGPVPATFTAGVESVDAVLDSGASAVVPYATSVALGLMAALARRGVDVPGQVLVSAERSVLDALGMTRVPAIDVDGELLGRVAAERLVERIERRGGTAGASSWLPVGVRLPTG
ncbi:LacI family DNA-binding transcriptional regulator [Streptomyces sp. NRRL F-5135]|uniref:LacI family DNA-binding transcriptional regulator n=1 Tax=Streptomyces sp. NRRL F-5135 TaxID=1463858 RepID=UPI000AF4F7F5|nr:LacI family DNA-binding transcriptional regulator [Streptomyces sp. NRRL F-5135]